MPLTISPRSKVRTEKKKTLSNGMRIKKSESSSVGVPNCIEKANSEGNKFFLIKNSIAEIFYHFWDGA